MAISFDIPQHLVAQSPAYPRDHAKLLVYDRSLGQLTDAYFYDLPSFLPASTTLVLNTAKVDKCRLLFGNREVFITQVFNPHTIEAMVRPGKKFTKGATIELADGVTAKVLSVDSEGLRTLELSCAVDDPRLATYQHTPFPPYIKASEKLADEYQTIYAQKAGSKAAPTAGLHFTPELLDDISSRQPVVRITLHVGLGTFAPLREENIVAGTLHSEEYEISAEAAEQLNKAASITAVGTTTTRCLEAAFHGRFEQTSGSTDIFIQPGYTFSAVDHMITNFHLPGTSLLHMIEAFVGSDRELQRIYDHAIAKEYRFYSFGDAMLIL